MASSSHSTTTPGWIAISLCLAGIYNLAWGAAVIAAPGWIFEQAGMEPPRYPEIWQCVGMIVGVYGIGYVIAARDSSRHWPIVLIGLLGKILGPIGFLSAAASGRLPWVWGWTIVTNDLIWWIPFTAALYYAWRAHSDSSAPARLTYQQAIRTMASHRGATLESLSRRSPTLVLFLRHAGCTFCREALGDLEAERAKIEAKGVQLAIVHMGAPIDGTMLLERYGMQDVHRFSDPECVLYDAFRVRRGTLKEILGPSVWLRGFYAAFVGGHGMGPVQGDVFRMPGLFALSDGDVVEEFHADYSSARPDYVAMAGRLAEAESRRQETRETVGA